MSTFKAVLWPTERGDVFGPEAAKSLTGQQPKLTEAFNHTRSLGRATIAEATYRDDGAIVVTLEVPDARAARVNDALWPAGRFDPDDPDELPPVSIGYIPTRGARREVWDLHVHEVATGVGQPPAVPTTND